MGDLISRAALKKEIHELAIPIYEKMVLKAIDNAPTVETYYTNDDVLEAEKEGYERGKEERPQGDLADEVWKLYKKHQSHLATYVFEFGEELKELLDKYQKGGAE